MVGCGIHDKPQLIRRGIVTDKSGKHRLILNYSKYDFHSLVWQKQIFLFWINHRTITRSDFQEGTNYRRWINDIHSFDPKTGLAILKVAESDTTNYAMACHIEYSWRLWDLNNNKQISILKICESPFDPF